jgi:hypothetical protein
MHSALQHQSVDFVVMRKAQCASAPKHAARVFMVKVLYGACSAHFRRLPMTWFQANPSQPLRRLRSQTHSRCADSRPAVCSPGPQVRTPQAQQRGSAVVEFALILPILLAVLVGGIDASLALYDKAVITNASREGARAGIVARNPMLTDAQIKAVVNQYAQSVVSFGAHPAQPTVLIQKGSLSGDATLRVTVSYTFQGMGLGSLLQRLGQPMVLQASTVMVYE